jgi:hypothetical protein
MIMAIPLAVYGIFLILHTRAYGAPFFNEHLEYVVNESGRMMSKLRSATSNLATRYGRNTLSAVALVSLIVLAARRQKTENARFLVVSMVLILSLIGFSIINFFTHRYILPVMPLFIAVCISLAVSAFQKRKLLVYALTAVVFTTTLIYSVTKMGKIDNDMGYSQYLKVHKELVHWCETNDKYESGIAAGYNMVLALRDSFNGYLTTERGFKVNHLPKTGGIDRHCMGLNLHGCRTTRWIPGRMGKGIQYCVQKALGRNIFAKRKQLRHNICTFVVHYYRG